MPLFEYRCGACGETCEVLSYTKDSGEARPFKCQSCGVYASLTLKVNGSTFDLRGAGFHCNDHPTQKTLPSKTQVAVGSCDD